MTADAHTLRAAAMEATAACNTARQLAEQAQTAAGIAEAGKYPDRAAAHLRAERAMQAFYAAMAVRDRARRALEGAQAARNGGESDLGAEVGLGYVQTKSKNYTGVIRNLEAS